MAALFGIHIGNTSACLAIWKDGNRVEVVANDSGDRVTPAIVQWSPTSCVMGRTAVLELYRNEPNSVIRNKQLMSDCVTDTEIERAKSRVRYKIHKTLKGVRYELLYDGKQHHVSPKDILGIIVKKLFAIAKSAVGGNVKLNAVLTVPLHFSMNSMLVIKEALRKAGFQILQVIDESTSAALGAGLGCSVEETSYHCLVYRIGGATLDATIFLVQDGMFSLLETVYRSNIGGELFTDILGHFLIHEFNRQFKTAALTEKSKCKLRTAAENIKQILSTQNLAQCSVESVGGGYDLNCSVSRPRFENMIAQFLPDVISPVRDVIEASHLHIDQIKKVVLCGGTMKIPKLQAILRSVLPSADFVVSSGFDELISKGAAMQAGYCIKFQHIPEDFSVNVPCISVLLAVKIKAGENEAPSSHIIPAFASLPLKKHYEVTSTDKCVSASLHAIKKGICTVGTVDLDELEPGTPFSVDLEIDKDGKLQLTVSEASGKMNDLKYDLMDLRLP